MTGERAFVDRCAALTERGRRRVNQDAVLIAELDAGRELIAVADGMGGHAAGEVASHRALEVLKAALERGVDLADAVRAANRALIDAATTHPEYQGMGTTLVALLRDGAHYLVANVGDSRAYRIDGTGVAQLTEDHSFVAEAMRSGLSAEEAEKSRWRNAVTRALGTEQELEVDCYGPFDVAEPHAIVLCTDGLHRVIPAQDLGRVVLGASAPDSAVRELTLSAYDRGSDDNITVALIRFGGDIVDSPAARLAAAFEVIDPTHVVRAPTTNGPSKQKPAAVPAAAAPAPNGTPRGAYTLPPEKRSSRPKGRSRRRTLRHRGWTQTQGIIIFLGFIAVIVYVALLLLVF
jgi:protein phosphatase